MWNILVCINGMHFKFWAYNMDSSDPRICWGRIGAIGVFKSVDLGYIWRKSAQKLLHGYRYITLEEQEKYFPNSLIALWEV